jgi:segregation and condensation protein B
MPINCGSLPRPTWASLSKPSWTCAPPEPLSQAALEVLAIVAYEQPVTRTDISHIRGTDSSGVIDTLIARGLIANDPRYGSRGRPAFLVTTEAFLHYIGVRSLAELSPLPATEPFPGVSAVAPA